MAATGETPTGDAPRRRWFIFAVCCVLMVVFAMASQALPAALAPVAREFQKNLAERGILFVLGAAGFIISTLLSGRCSDRFGRKPVVVVGAATLAAGLGLTAWGRDYNFVRAGLFLMGVSGGFLESPVSAAAVEAFPRHGAQALNAVQLFFNIGAVAGPAIVGAALGLGLGWRAGFAALFLLTIISIFLTCAGLPGRARSEGEARGTGKGSPIPWGLVAQLSIAICLYVGSELTIAQWSANYVEATFGVPSARAALVVSGFWLAMMVGRGAYIGLVGRFGHLGPLLVSSALGAVAMTVAALAGTGLVACVACCATGLALAGSWPTIVGYAAHRHKGDTGAIFGVIIASGAVGSLIFPPLGGWLAQHSRFGLRAAVAMAAVLIVLEGIVLALVKMRAPRELDERRDEPGRGIG